MKVIPLSSYLKKSLFILITLALNAVQALHSQPGKNGSYTVSSTNQILNKYCPITTNISSGSNTLVVVNSTMLAICPGDLIMVYQAQGASINTLNTLAYGDITSYNSAGLFEFKYVQTIIGNTITCQTPFSNTYLISGRTQVVTVPQYFNLTINANSSIVAKPWKDTIISAIGYRFGGIVAIHSSNIINNGTISANFSGFRGGLTHIGSPYVTGVTAITTSVVVHGGEKGEGIFGFQLEYDSNGGRYSRGAPANGGGGGSSTNAGAGGGANGYNGNPWTGQGVMVVNANNPLSAWSLDPGYVANANSLTNSSGGGKGGYSWGDVNGNATIHAPGSFANWQGDSRRAVGGIGGRPLMNINSESRIYFGGGGGAGEGNNSAASNGGNGGGIIYIITTNSISGAGLISSNGNSVALTTGCHCDGSGGGGAGGSIIIKTTNISATQSVTAIGGVGGTQMQPISPAHLNESEGPGGGGGGGYIALSAVGIIPNVNGGINGQTFSNALTEMPFNGATQGGSGQIAAASNTFISYALIPTLTLTTNAPICEGGTLTLSTSTLSGATYSWSGPNGISASGSTFSVVNTSTLFSGNYTVIATTSNVCAQSGTVNAVVNTLPSLTVSSSQNTVCSGTSATLTASGALNYTWQPTNSNNTNIVITPTSTSNFSLYATDLAGCSNSITFVQSTHPTPTINALSTHSALCNGENAVLSVTGANTYTWLPSNIFSSSLTVSPSLTTVYTIEATSLHGCSVSTSFTQTVTPLPSLMANASSTLICPGDVVTLSVSGAQSYMWNTGFTGSSFTISPNSPSSFSVVGTASNCSSQATVFVAIKPTPTLSFNTFSITCGSLGSATVSASGGTGPFSYTWTPTGQTNSVATGLFPGTYTLTFLDAGTGCVFTPTTTFFPLVPLTGTVSSTNSLLCNGINTGTASIALSNGSGTQTYTWTNSIGASNTATVSGLAAGISTVQVIDALTYCAVTHTFLITQPPALSLSIVASTPSVCVGGSISLNASNSGGIAPYTYTWAAGPSGTILSVSEASAGIFNYTVNSLDANLCLSSLTHSLSFVPNPTLSVSNVSICPLETGSLVVSGASSYTWNSGLVGPVFAASPSVNTQYTVVGSALSCSSSATASILLKPVPVAFASNNGPVCTGQTLLLFSSGGSASWTGPLSFTSALTSPSINASAQNASGIYQVIVTAANNCTASTITSASVHPVPFLSVLGSTVCEGQNLNLYSSALPGASYFWQGPALFTSTLSSPVLVSSNTLMTGAYALHITSAQGCTTNAQLQASVAPMPSIAITGNSVVCQGDNLSLSASGADTYAWYGPSNFSHNTASFTLTNVHINAAGFYSLIASQGPCQVNTGSFVTVNALPQPTIGNSGPVCENGTVQFFTGPAASYTWSGPQNFSSNQQNPVLTNAGSSVQGIYSLTVQDNNSCRASTASSLLVLLNPVPVVSGDSVCFGENAQLSVSGGVSYLWLGPAGFTSTLSSVLIPQVTATSSGNYSVIVTAQNNCTVQALVPLMGLPYALPQPIISGNNKPCLHSALLLSGSGGIAYLWSGPNGFTATTQQFSLVSSSPSVSGVYTLSVINASNCSASGTVQVEVLPLPKAQLLSSLNQQCVPFCSEFNLVSDSTSVPLSGSNIYFNGQTFTTSPFQLCFLQPGQFSLSSVFTDTNGCVNNSVFLLNAYPKVVADFYFEPQLPLAGIDQVQFVNASQGQGQTQWNWLFMANNNDTVFTQNCTYLFEQPGKYPVVLLVKNQWGCIDTVIKTVVIEEEFAFYVPNSFTPNGDGINDVFQPKGMGFTDYTLDIYDRWGERIFSTNSFYQGWDGYFKGAPCQNGIYNWVIQIKTPQGILKSKNGTVLLLR